MVATVGVVWTIGIATYTFIWNYFWSWAKEPENREKPGARGSMKQNLVVYCAYLLIGFFSAFSIYLSTSVLASGQREGLSFAWNFFLLVVLGHLFLFSFEIATSIWKVVGLIQGRE